MWMPHAQTGHVRLQLVDVFFGEQTESSPSKDRSMSGRSSREKDGSF